MKCVCGYYVPAPKVNSDRLCEVCGQPLALDIEDMLLYGHNGLVKSVRPGQVEMGKLVDRLINENASGIIEGPVGIGKSFAYMLPAMLSGKRILISTAKKQLQHQLYHDAPQLAHHIEKPGLQTALLKGKSNYACLLRSDDIPDPDAREKVQNWLRNQAETGDIVEAMAFYGGRRPKFWFDITAEDCIGASCRLTKMCGYWRAKQQAKVAQVVIANHYVTAFDLRFGPFKLLPKYDVLVIDEAHQAPQAFRQAFAASVTPFVSMRILKAIDKCGLNTGHEKRLEDVWKEMFKRVESIDGEIPKDPFTDAGDEAIEILQAINKAATDGINDAGGKVSVTSGEDDDEEAPSGTKDYGAIVNFTMLKKHLDRALGALRSAKEPDQNTVVYITTSPGPNKYKTVNVAPISVGSLIGSKLQQVPTVIVTSATITVNGNFDDIKKQLGMDYERQQANQPAPTGPVTMAQAAGTVVPTKAVETMVLESPFDYRRQAVLYTPKHIPLPVSGGSGNFVSDERSKYLNALTSEIARLLRASDGNAFILFSATSDAREVRERLEEEDLKGVHLIEQGDDAEAAFAEFKKTPRSAILGLKSFWEGVDVQGDKLRLVIITKLPFPMPSDPVIQARSRQEKKAAVERGIAEREADGLVFRMIMIPQMITDLRQGAGRLIRSVTDRGVLAILDARVWTGSAKQAPKLTDVSYRGYGATVVNALGFSQKTSDFTNVSKFLEKIKATEKL